MGICSSVRMATELLNGSFLTGLCDRSLSVGLMNGGFAGLWWVFLGTVTCYSTIVASLAEMESMAPTSGGMYGCFRDQILGLMEIGQYHWVSEFSPPKYQKILSYTAGDDISPSQMHPITDFYEQVGCQPSAGSPPSQAASSCLPLLSKQ
jgi:hypothetical protein